MTIYLYNTLSRTKEELKPAHPGEVRMYVCGPTTYNYIHVGNARALVVFDTIRRYLEYRGYKVTYVQNFTDIDDKIIKRAGEEGISPLTMAQKYIHEYYRDAEALMVRQADYHPLVSQHIKEIIELILRLIKTGHAYEIEGDVYFAVDSFPAYGRLSGRNLMDLNAGSRVEIDPRKKNPFDFALWKKAKPGEPAWESPWGEGRPGWHIECSAMALKYLGENFDIHGGGFDLIFPHHENELAQAEAAGSPFAKYWLHNGFITVNQEKMSKSLGNFFLVRQVLERYAPAVLRYYLLTTHYRNPMDFDDEKLTAAQKGLERLTYTYRGLGDEEPEPSAYANEQVQDILAETRAAFEKAMDDDFNTALALAALHDLARQVNSWHSANKLASADKASLKKFLDHTAVGVLGLNLDEAEAPPASEHSLEKVMAILLDIRQEARKQKNWALADDIRHRLQDIGITLEDTADGVHWRQG